MVFGGEDAAGTALGDVWAFSTAGLSWSPLSPTGTPPGPRFAMLYACDPDDDWLIAVGGEPASYADAWALKMGTVVPTWVPLGPVAPLAEGGAAYDSRHHRVLLAGLRGAKLDLWDLSLDAATLGRARRLCAPSAPALGPFPMFADLPDGQTPGGLLLGGGGVVNGPNGLLGNTTSDGASAFFLGTEATPCAP